MIVIRRNKDGRRKSIPRHASSTKAVNKKSNLQKLRDDFESHADAIMSAYRNRPAKGVAPNENAEGFFKREAYALIRKIIDMPNGTRVFTRILSDWDVLPRSPTLIENAFFWGLLAMDPEGAHIERVAKWKPRGRSKTDKENFLDRRKRSKYAKQLLFAHINDVPPEYLVGFIYQVGGVGVIDEK